jgi:gamma-glutamylcyclotransferase (GGCT)/AIG2-like uncharacterized protein YtfP
MPLLFSYGTLQQDEVQIATFGRLLSGEKDNLLSYRLTEVQILDPDVVKKSGKTHHPIVIYTGETTHLVEGIVFEISEKELEQADAYEVSDYQRVTGQLSSGKTAWVYVDRRRYKAPKT